MMLTLANCIINRKADYVRQYLLAGAELNQFDEYGFTPLIESAITNDETIAQILLEHKADPNFKDMVGGTALHWAVENNNQALAKLLIDYGADANSYNHYSEPAIVKAILRQQNEMKEYLYQNGASSTFAYDYINFKLLGHRFDLEGSMDIVDAQGQFTELDFEGFVMEFSLSLLTYSLEQFTQNYAAKTMQPYFPMIHRLIAALRQAAALIHYQQYLTDRQQHHKKIDALLREELLILPVVFNGHTIAMIRYQDQLVIIDRRARQAKTLYGICVYKLTKPKALTSSLLQHLLYEKKTDEYIYERLPKLLGLKLVSRLLIEPQLSGNCSWANLAATIPAVLYLIDPEAPKKSIIDHEDHWSLIVYRYWREWDKERAIHYCLNSFDKASPARKASIASALAAILYQRLSYQDDHHVTLARRILKILRTEAYAYILENYLNFYWRERRTKAGENLEKLIQRCDEVY